MKIWKAWKVLKRNVSINLLDAIADTKGVPLHRLISAMGIEHIGEVAGKSLALEFGLGIVDATLEQVVAIDGIGEEMANSLLEFMRVNHDFVLKLFEVHRSRR